MTGSCGPATSNAATLTITYSVAYNSNGSTSGSVPTDAAHYTSGQTVTVLGNTGILKKTGYSFGGWTNSQDALVYQGNDPFIMGTANVILTAKWNMSQPTISPQPVLPGSIPCTTPITIFLAATGAGPFTYQWYLNGASMGSSYVGTSISVSTGGTYKCIVTDANGGTSTSNSVVYYGALAGSIATTKISGTTIYPDHVEVCANGSFSLQCNVTGGVQPYTYSWMVVPDDGSFNNSNAASTGTIIFDEGWYDMSFTFHCLVTDARNCQIDVPILVNQVICSP